jgi:hypothetical protein
MLTVAAGFSFVPTASSFYTGRCGRPVLMSDSFENLARMKNRPKKRQRRTRRLVVQSLETRCVLAADPFFCIPHLAGAAVAEAQEPSSQPAPVDQSGPAIFSEPFSTGLATVSSGGEGEAAAWVRGRSPFDPSGDGLVTPLDALNVLVHLSYVQRGVAVNDQDAITRFDTNGDNDVTPLDALVILVELSTFSRTHGGMLNVPIVSWANDPTLHNGSLVTDDLALQMSLAADVDAVYGRLATEAGSGPAIDLSGLVEGRTLQLSHQQVVDLFAPLADQELLFSFWTDLPDHTVQTVIEVTWRPATQPAVLWIENADNGPSNIIDRTHASYPLIQSSVVAQGTHAFHLAHPTAASDWFEIDRDLSIGSDTKLFFMSRLKWATPNQVAKVQVSTDSGVTWPNTIFSQAGDADNPQGDGDFVFRQMDLSAFAGRDIRIRFYYEYNVGPRFGQTDTDVGWVIDDIRIASVFETAAYSIGQPTALEQWSLELINRARADGIAEANRLASDSSLNFVFTQFRIDPADIVSQYAASIDNGFFDRFAQPLAFNEILLQAARLHSQDLLTNAFQGHVSSSNPPSPFQPGFSAGDRANSLGYQTGVAENVFSYSTSVPFAHAGFAVDWGPDSPDLQGYNPAFAGQGMQNPADHRKTIHTDRYNEIGIGVLLGTNGLVGPEIVTQKFGSSGVPMITGVVYVDQDNNDFYSPGEGAGGIRVDVSGAAFHAITSTSGGYAIPLPGNGTYQVTFSGAGIATWTTEVIVTNLSNVKVDYVLPA